MKCKRIILATAICFLNLSLISVTAFAASSTARIPVRAEQVCESVEGVKVHGYSEGMYLISDQNGQYGFVDSNWKDIIKPQYDSAQPFYDGLAVAEKNGKFGCINKSGKTVVPFQWDSLDKFEYSLALAAVGSKEDEYSYVEGKYGFINASGKTVIPLDWDKAESFSDGLAVVTKGDKSGYLNAKGELVIPCKYDTAYSFHNKYAVVCEDGKWGVINQQGRYVIKPVWNGIMGDGQNGIYTVMQVEQGGRYSFKYGFVNIQNQVILAPKYDEVYEFNHGYANVRDTSGKYGLIDTKGNWTIKPIYSAPLDYEDNGLIPFSPNGSYGYMDFNGNIVIQPQFSMAYSFSKGTAGVQKNGGTGIINVKGSYLIAPTLGYQEIVLADDENYLIAQKQNRSAVYKLIYQ